MPAQHPDALEELHSQLSINESYALSLMQQAELAEDGGHTPSVTGAATDSVQDHTEVGDPTGQLHSKKMPVHLHGQPAAEGCTDAVTALAYSHNSRLVATGSADTSLIIWDASRHETILRKWNAHLVLALAFSPDDRRLASAGADGNVVVWSVETGECLRTMSGHEKTIRAMTWSADGKWIASGAEDLSVRLWDARTYEQKFGTVLDGRGPRPMVTFVCFSHNSRSLAAGAHDYAVVWDVAEQGTVAGGRELRGHMDTVWRGAFDADDERLVTCSDDWSARVWSVKTGEMLIRIDGRTKGPVWDAAFSEDGAHVLTTSGGEIDTTMMLHAASTGECKLAFEGHEAQIDAVCFSPDGKYAGSGSHDTTVRLWRVADGTLLKTFEEHDDKVRLVEFSPDGRTLASGSDDGTVRIRLANEWDVDRAAHGGGGGGGGGRGRRGSGPGMS